MTENYTVITLGFKSGLNYPFVVAHSLASAQVFQYLPGTLAYPFKGDQTISVKQLVPFQSPSLKYIVTIAEVYFPKDWISALNQSIQTGESTFYFNPDPTENSLAQLIDVNIPLVGLDSAGSDYSGYSSGSSSAQSVSGGLVPTKLGSMDSESSTSSLANNKLGVVGTTSGISAAVYISVLLVGFRMYKQRKGSLPFSTEQTGDITLPIHQEELDNESMKQIEPETNINVNPVYGEGPIERRMSYQSFKSYAGSSLDTNSTYQPEYADVLTITEDLEDDLSDTDTEDATVDNIIPHISHPVHDNWM